MERKRAIRQIGFVVLAVGVLPVAGKAGMWWTTGSLTLGSEVANSLADAVYSIITLGGPYPTTKLPDWEHPHGHERIESFISFFVVVDILAVGKMILWQSTSNILAETYGGDAETLGVVVLVVAVTVRYVLCRYYYLVGRGQNSPTLVATGVDNRSDILAAGVAFIGAAGG